MGSVGNGYDDSCSRARWVRFKEDHPATGQHDVYEARRCNMTFTNRDGHPAILLGGRWTTEGANVSRKIQLRAQPAMTPPFRMLVEGLKGFKKD